MSFEKMKKALKKELDKGSISLPSDKTPIEREGAKLVFVVWADPQIHSFSPVRSAKLYAACRDLENMPEPLDALVLTGDIAEYGRKCEYEMTADLLNAVGDKYYNMYAVSGNHDVRIRNFEKQRSRFNSFIKSVKNGDCDENSYYFSREINGYKFIMLGTDSNTFEAAFFGDEQLAWLDREIADGEKNGKPVFVFNHQTLKNHNGLPNTWLGKGDWRGSVGEQSGKLKAIFEKHKATYFISGHLHWCTNKYSIEDYGAYKSVSVPTVSVNNHGVYPKFCQGAVFHAYDDKVVVRMRLFGEGKYVGDEAEGSEAVFASKCKMQDA